MGLTSYLTESETGIISTTYTGIIKRVKIKRIFSRTIIMTGSDARDLNENSINHPHCYIQIPEDTMERGLHMSNVVLEYQISSRLQTPDTHTHTLTLGLLCHHD